MTNSFHDGSSLSLRVLGAEGKALDSGGEIKLTHLLTQAAVGHVGLGRQVNWSFCGNTKSRCQLWNDNKKSLMMTRRRRATDLRSPRSFLF